MVEYELTAKALLVFLFGFFPASLLPFRCATQELELSLVGPLTSALRQCLQKLGKDIPHKLIGVCSNSLNS